MNKLEIYTDLMRCGYMLNPKTNRWTPKESVYALPNIHAQYIDYNATYQYSKVRKLK